MDILQARSFRVRGLRFGWRSAVGLLLCVGSGLALGLALAPKVPYTFRVTARIVFSLGREQSMLRPELSLIRNTGDRMWRPGLNELRDFAELLVSGPVLRPTVESLYDEIPGFTFETAGGSGGFLAVIGRLAEPVTEKFGVHTEGDPKERAVAAWADSFRVDDVWSTAILDLICNTTEPDHGVAFLDRVISNYKQLHMKTYGPARERSFVEDHLVLMRQQHEEAANALTEFRLDTGVLDMEAQKRDLIVRMLAAENDQRRLSTEESGLVARIGDAEAFLEELPEYQVQTTRITMSGTRREAERQVLQEEQELIRLSGLYQEVAAFIGRSGELIKRLEELLEQEAEMQESSINMALDPVVTKLREKLIADRARLESVRAERQQLQATIEHARSGLARLENQRTDLTNLMTEYDEAKRDLGRAVAAARIVETNQFLDEAEVTNVAVLEPPTARQFPEQLLGYQHRVAIVYAGALLGFLVWATLFMLRNVLHEDLRIGVEPGSPADVA